MARSKNPGPGARGPVRAVQYAPPTGHALDVELFPAAELRRRVLSIESRGAERIDFLCLILVTAGRYSHVVDFQNFDCPAGSVLALQPGQVHTFGNMHGWDGWMLIFRSELLRARADSRPVDELDFFRDATELPAYVRVAGPARDAITACFERMAEDARLPAPAPAVNALLRHQLHALLVRLHLAHASSSRPTPVEAAMLERFRRFRALVEREHRRWHGVGQYAKQLGCSEKTLTRATMAVTDVGAKAFLTNRIVLEAQRLLVHTRSPVATIAEQLGFDEATNFVKFFRREAGITPGAFRAKLAGSGG